MTLARRDWKKKNHGNIPGKVQTPSKPPKTGNRPKTDGFGTTDRSLKHYEMEEGIGKKKSHEGEC